MIINKHKLPIGSIQPSSNLIGWEAHAPALQNCTRVRPKQVWYSTVPIYCKNLKQTDISRLNNLQYRAAKIVTGAFHFTSKDKLNNELGWETIEKRSDFLGLNLFHKIHKSETRPLIRSCMPTFGFKPEPNLRTNGGYIHFKYYNIQFHNSFFPHFSRRWNTFPESAKSKDVLEFKEYLKQK